jgi:hypothetical protein
MRNTLGSNQDGEDVDALDASTSCRCRIRRSRCFACVPPCVSAISSFPARIPIDPCFAAEVAEALRPPWLTFKTIRLSLPTSVATS